MKKIESDKSSGYVVDEQEELKNVPAFQDPEYHLLESYSQKQRLSILNLRRRYNCSISEAIDKFSNRPGPMKTKRKKKSKKHKGTLGVGNSVITSLIGKTSARNWKTVK